MASSYNYLPQPPRAWSRVQSLCTYINPDDNYSSVYIPLTGQTVSSAKAELDKKMQYKGNILQYKANSSNQPKQILYSRIYKGLGPNRKKSYATQGIVYTNPNTCGLTRINYNNLPFPNQIVGAPNNISGPYQYGLPNPFDCSSNSIQDGGSLICGSFSNPCTGEIIRAPGSPQLCYPTYCSDVPGQAMYLCWNPKMPVFFPRNNLNNNNSGNKWPQGYKGLVSAITPPAPVLNVDSSSNTIICTSVNLSWTINNNNMCVPISSYNIYQNGALINTVPYPLTSTTAYNLTNQTYIFYVTSISNTIQSTPSNSVSVTITESNFLAPVLTIVSTTITSITLSWTFTNNVCIPVSLFNIYQNGTIVSNVQYPSTTTTINNLVNPSSFYVTSVSNTTQSSPSNTVYFP